MHSSNPKFFINKVIVKESPGLGRGVFAAENIKKGEIIEVSPIIVLKFEDFVETKWNLLFEYYFWLDNEVVLALGYGSLYNHSAEANAQYQISIKKRSIKFTAIKDIKKSQEIFFNYKGSRSSKTPLWFEKKDI